MHTHRFLPSLLSARQRLELGEDDCVVLYLPFFHVYALMAGLVLMTAVGAKLVLMERFDAAGSLQLMAAERATVVYGVPTTYIDQLAAPAIDTTDLSSVRVSITSCRAAALQTGWREGHWPSRHRADVISYFAACVRPDPSSVNWPLEYVYRYAPVR